MNTETTKEIDVGLIDPSPTNRKQFDQEALKELSESIKTHGILNDLIVRPGKNGEERFELVAGERRWRGAQMAGLKVVPCKVRDLTDAEVLESQAIENLQREDLSPIDEAWAYQHLLTCYEHEGHGHESAILLITEETGKSRSTIYERLSLLKLAAPVQKAVQIGKLPASHAALLTKVQDPDRQARLSQLIAPANAKEARKVEDEEDYYEERDEETLVIPFREVKELVDQESRLAKQLEKYNRLAETFRAKGGTTLTYTEAREQRENLVASGDYLSAIGHTITEKLGQSAGVKMIMRPNPMNPSEAQMVYPKDKLVAALKKAGVKPASTSSSSEGGRWRTLERNRLAKERQKKAILAKALPAIRAAAGKRNAKIPWGLVLASFVGHWQAHRVCKQRGWKSSWNTGAKVLAENVDKLPANRISGLMADLAIERYTHPGGSGYDKGLVELGTFYGVDLKAMEKEAKEEKAAGQTSGRKKWVRPKLSAKSRATLSTLMKARWAARKGRKK